MTAPTMSEQVTTRDIGDGVRMTAPNDMLWLFNYRLFGVLWFCDRIEPWGEPKRSWSRWKQRLIRAIPVRRFRPEAKA